MIIYGILYFGFNVETFWGKDITEFLEALAQGILVVGVAWGICILTAFNELKPLKKTIEINKKDKKADSYSLSEFDSVKFRKNGRKRFVFYSVNLVGSSSYERFRVWDEQTAKIHCQELAAFLGFE